MSDLIGILSSGLGLVASTLGIYGFASSRPKDPDNAVVRVFVGMSGYSGDATHLGGNTPGVAMWNVAGEFWGKNHGEKKYRQPGTFFDLRVDPVSKMGNSRPDYIQITDGGPDGICIAALAISFPDGGELQWAGDIGAKCGSTWYHSETILGDKGMTPRCMWVDRDQTGGPHPQAFSFHMRDFIPTEGRVKQYTDYPDTLCKSAPRFATHMKKKTGEPIDIFAPPLEYNDDLTDIDLQAVINPRMKQAPLGKYGCPPACLGGGKMARSTNGTARTHARDLRITDVEEVDEVVEEEGQEEEEQEEPPRFEIGEEHYTRKMVVKGRAPNHSAKELCESTASFGPDFVSVQEQLFCDMASKQLWPVCGADEEEVCFDAEKNEMRATNLTDAVGFKPRRKAYEKVLEWGSA